MGSQITKPPLNFRGKEYGILENKAKRFNVVA
ncbi:MAG: hypothetical protein ACI8Y9_001597 [Paracoccaceae bacterium]|jgi:hypothetical protein